MIKTILDMCCGSRMFWLDRADARVMFCDIRSEQHTLCDGRSLNIAPDMVADFRALPFEHESFNLIVFDPPRLEYAGETSWLRAKYGVLNKATCRDDLAAGFREAFRVLRPGGTLIFKWDETLIATREILVLTPYKPPFGHTPGKRAKTDCSAFVNCMNMECYQRPGNSLSNLKGVHAIRVTIAENAPIKH